MAKIILSYRRNDSKWLARHIFEYLGRHFGKNNVFIDVDNVPIGTDYRVHIQNVLRECEVMIVVIGPNWVEELRRYSRVRANDNPDWVRLEISTALRRNIHMVPLLVDGTKMPSVAELP